MLAVEGVLGLGDALDEVVAELLGGVGQSRDNVAVGDGRVLDGDVVLRRTLIADGSGVDDAVERRVERAVTDASGRADADEGVRAAGDQLFETDRGGRAAHAGGDDGDGNAVERAGPGLMLAVVRDELCIIKIGCDQVRAERIAGEQDIAADVALAHANVIGLALICKNSHSNLPPIIISCSYHRERQ